MKKPLPPKDQIGINDITDEPAVNDGNRDEFMSSGMSVGEAVDRAAAWWEVKGRTIMRQQRLKGSKNAAAFNVQDVDDPNFIPSNIIAGKSWSELAKDEKMRIVKMWHHHVIRVPDMDPEAYLRAAANPMKCFYCDVMASADETLPNGEERPLCAEHFKDRYPDIANAYEAAAKANDNGRMN